MGLSQFYNCDLAQVPIWFQFHKKGNFRNTKVKVYSMSHSKHFDAFAWSFTAIILAITLVFMNGASLGITVMAHTMGYENRLFDNSRMHTIDIVMNDWDTFIANATSEEYYTAALVIDGESYKNVAIRGKGNTSLSTVSSLDSERYSFKVEFDHYDSSITYHGLDKLSLNNLIQDSTMMKDYLTYTMMAEFGAAAPLCSFAYITVNGEDWGLYLAVEGVEDSFLERNYGTDSGELYKPDSMSFGGGRGNGKDFRMDDFMNNAESSDSTDNSTVPQIPDMQSGEIPDMGDFDPSQMQGGELPDMENIDPSQMQGGFGGGRGGMGGMDSFSIDEEALRAAFDQLGIDQSLLDGVDFENLTMETIQSVLSALDEETVQKLMQEVMNSGAFEMPDMGDMGGMGGMGSSDVKLQYIDDSIDSYSNIWNNAKTDITTADQNRLIASLKQLSAYDNVDDVVDIDAVIRYFVVHNYVCNGDSYTGSMIHNYYLYEKDGQLSMIPWDYNLAFGTFQGSNAQSTVNTPIDSPVDGGSSDDRPMWNWILSNDSYTELYHQYFAEFLNTVDVQAIIENAYSLIKSYVEKDPTAFYTYDEFETGVDALLRFCALRSESITEQLANGETTQTMDYADASDLNTSDMGSMNMGGGGKMSGDDTFRENNRGNRGTEEREQPTETAESAETTPILSAYSGTMMTLSATSVSSGSISILPLASGNTGGGNGGFAGGTPPDGFDPGTMTGGGFGGGDMPTDGFGGGDMPEGFDPNTMPDNGMMPGTGTMPDGNIPDGSATENTDGSAIGNIPSAENGMTQDMTNRMPDNLSNSMPGTQTGAIDTATLIPVVISVVILAIGLIIAKKYPA